MSAPKTPGSKQTSSNSRYRVPDWLRNFRDRGKENKDQSESKWEVHFTLEQELDKINKITVHPSKTQIGLATTQSDQSLRCALNG